MKKLFKALPEFYFIGLGGLWITQNYFATGQINYIALLITWLIFLQVFYKNKMLGLLYGNILALFSVYMLLDILSRNQEIFVSQQISLILLGSVIFCVGFVMAVVMIYNYATTASKFNENELTMTY